MVGNRQKCCFELYGFDIMFDQNFKPWVLEVNCLPSLSSSSAFDKDVKTKLICDTFNLLGMRGYNKKVLEKRLKKNKEFMLPIFNQSFDKTYIEDKGNIYKIKQNAPLKGARFVLSEIQKPIADQFNQEILPETVLNLSGFDGTEIFSRDELNIILDLEDEMKRLGNFK